jgi:two-component system phosphate regulon sensor histidine kinase PhoR
MLYVAVPIDDGNKVKGVLRVSIFLRTINFLVFVLKRSIFKLLLVFIVLCIIVSYVFSKNIVNPVRELTKAARRVASGNFNSRVLLKNKDEFRELGESFNYMTEEINLLFSEVVRKKEELDVVIQSMQEGLLVLDRDGKVVIVNRSLAGILETDIAEGKYYWEAVREKNLAEFIKKAHQDRENYTEEISLSYKELLCSSSFLNSREEVLILIHDITRIKEIETIKKDFVVNVSHELRTPLTAIKGFVETLQGSSVKDRKHFHDVIRKHTDRLINIVNDLLVLSELENKAFQLEKNKVDVVKLVGDVLKIFEGRIKQKKLKLKFEKGSNITPIKADAFKLEQVFINILDNAVKYTDKGAISVTLYKEPEGARIEIRDTGIGIPKEHIPRIFERFYVVDKSRSRKLGGTGLGLSIVKHIITLHNGDISVKSIQGKGTAFTIYLPA